MITDLCQRGHHSHCWDDACECIQCHFTCPRCHGRVKKLNDGLCAPCYRDRAAGQPFDGTPCDNCGRKPAFRNPGHRRDEYLCAQCQAATGESLPLTSGVQGIIADCAGLDVSDPKHDPYHVRGHRIMCRKCKRALQVKKPAMEPQTRRQRAGLKNGRTR